MASYASAANDVNFVQQNYRAFLLRVEEIRQDVANGAGVNQIGGTVARLLSSIAAQRSLIANIQDVTIPSIDDASQAQIEALYNLAGEVRDNLNNLTTELRNLLTQARQNDKNRNLLETQPKNSAGDIVDNEQDAQKADAKVQTPQQDDLTLDNRGRVVDQPENTNTGTNAREPNTQDDVDSNITGAGGAGTAGGAAVGNQASGGATSNVGGDAPVVKSEQTQRTNNGAPGATAPDDDFTAPGQTSTATSVGSDNRPAVAREFLEPIVAQPNLLSGLSSMTYALSLYLMSPDEYGEFVVAENKVLPTNQLLMQSAGINKAERNEWFNVDFYIENFTLESVVGTQAAGSPHNAVTLEFDVVEPQGITFLNRLNNAVIAHIGEQEKKTSALAQTYLMVIRFYGYDAAGNMVTSSDLGLPTTTDSEAIIEKFIPFMITNFAYKITTKATEYRIKGACHGTNLAFSTARGVVPFNIQLTASTIDQLFNGNLVLSENQNENTANAGNNQAGATQTVVQGLVQALNEQQLRLAGESYDIPDQYEVVFQDADIKNAKMLKPGNVNKGRAANQTAVQAAQKYLESKVNYDKESATYNVLAGTQIVQLIDLVLRTSSYITSQQDVYIDEQTGQAVPAGGNNGQASSVPTVQWYRIKTQISPLGYDYKRNTVAYKITYFVNKYQINTPRSPYFPPAEYRGVHKLYNYWFTGQNTEVLDFEIDVNSNYFVTIGNDGRIDTRDPGKFPVTQNYAVAPGQSLQGGERGSTTPAANLSDRLYSFADVASSTIEIVGDPDWIQQNEIVYNRSVTLNPFLPDGSVNYDGSEVLFELRFNPVQDYDLETGLSNVYENNREISFAQANGETLTEANVAQESLVWCATTVTSVFSEGRFIQRLTGVYRDFNSAKNAPVNPQAQVVLSNGNTVEQSLARREEDSDPSASNGGGVGNRARAQAQRNNINSGTPSSGVTTRNVTGGRSAAARRNNTGVVVEIVPGDQFPDDDAGTILGP